MFKEGNEGWVGQHTTARAERSDVMVQRWRLKYRLWDTLQVTRMGLDLILSAEVDD